MSQKLEVQKILKWLNRRTGNKPPICPVCKNERWMISETSFELREFSGGEPAGAVLGPFTFPLPTRESVPLFCLTCESCGFTELFNAEKAGVLKEG